MQGLRQLQQTVEPMIDDGSICSKSAAKSLLQVEIRLRPGSGGLADRTSFSNRRQPRRGPFPRLLPAAKV
jgi:hypothetical protein